MSLSRPHTRARVAHLRAHRAGANRSLAAHSVSPDAPARTVVAVRRPGATRARVRKAGRRTRSGTCAHRDVGGRWVGRGHHTCVVTANLCTTRLVAPPARRHAITLSVGGSTCHACARGRRRCVRPSRADGATPTRHGSRARAPARPPFEGAQPPVACDARTGCARFALPCCLACPFYGMSRHAMAPATL